MFPSGIAKMKIIFNCKINGYPAILLPFQPDGAVDWDAFCAHIARTAEAGQTPAVNMDTGSANLIDEKTREEVLRRTRDTLSGTNFTAGAMETSDLPAPKSAGAAKKEKSRLHPFCTDVEILKWLAEYAPFEKLAIVHAGVQQEAEQMLAQIKHFLPQGEIPIVQITPVLGAHLGVGAPGFACVSAKENGK